MSNESLKRDISKISLLFISFTAIFGSGWLFAPLYAAQTAGPNSLLAWALGGLIAAIIGITMAEVISLFPKTGGLNSVIAITRGELLGLIVTVLNLLVLIILPAIEVRAVLQYLSSHFSSLMSSNDSLSLTGYLLSFFLLLIITLINTYGARLMAKLTQVVVILKIITPFILGFSFLYFLSKTNQLSHANLSTFYPIQWDQVLQAIATSGIIFSFNGFNQATVFAGEAKDPKKSIPFAILGSLLLTSCLYLFIQYVFLVSLPASTLANGWKNLSFPGDRGPFAGIAVLLGLNWLLSVIYLDAVISPLGTAFTYASSAPRILYSLSETSQALPRLRLLNQHGVPHYSILVAFFLECLAFALLPNLKAMISLLVAAFVLCYTVAPVSLLGLRQSYPDKPRSFRVHFAPLFCYLSIFFSNLMVFSAGWEALRNLLITSILLISVFFYVSAGKTTPNLIQLNGSRWFLIQLIGISLFSYLSHAHQLSFKFAIIGIGILSGLVLFLSQLRRSH